MNFVRIQIKNDVFMLTLLTLLIFIAIQLASLGFFGTKGVEVSQIRENQEYYIQENEYLKAKINELQSLERIEKIARNDFGMIDANEVTYIAPDPRVSSDLTD